MKKNIYETRESEIISIIRMAIFGVTGIDLVHYSSKSREQKYFFLRIIFSYHCVQQNIEPMEYLNRHRTTKYHYLKQYENEYKYNRDFKELANKIATRINNKLK
jgi:hypothetical protein